MAELNIAIADDNRQTLELLGEILEGEKDYHVVGKADNGNEAYNMIMKTRPDVVLMDIVMPGMDGISVMEKIKKQRGNEGQHLFYYGYSRRKRKPDGGGL